MTHESFVRAYRFAVLGGMAAWRLALFNPLRARGLHDALEGLVHGVGLGLLPAAALACLVGRSRARSAPLAAAGLLFGTEAVAFALSQSSSSSTAGVVVMLAPLLELVTVVPAAALLRVLLDRRSEASKPVA